MTRTFPLLAALGCLLALTSIPASAGEPERPVLAVIDIHEIGHERLEGLKATPGLDWWVELDDQLLVAAPENVLADIGQRAEARRLGPVETEEGLYFVRTAHHQRLDDLAGLRTLAQGGAWAVVSTARIAGRNSAATSAFTSSVSAALQTPGRWTFAL